MNTPAGGRIRSQGNKMRRRRNHEWAEGGVGGVRGGRGAGLALL